MQFRFKIESYICSHYLLLQTKNKRLNTNPFSDFEKPTYIHSSKNYQLTSCQTMVYPLAGTNSTKAYEVQPPPNFKGAK
jgi:hypothetical protein